MARLEETVPEISIKVPPSATTVLVNVTKGSLPATSFSEVLTEKSNPFEVNVRDVFSSLEVAEAHG